MVPTEIEGLQLAFEVIDFLFKSLEFRKGTIQLVALHLTFYLYSRTHGFGAQ